jgi:hypothetical protein
LERVSTFPPERGGKKDGRRPEQALYLNPKAINNLAGANAIKERKSRQAGTINPERSLSLMLDRRLKVLGMAKGKM